MKRTDRMKHRFHPKLSEETFAKNMFFVPIRPNGKILRNLSFIASLIISILGFRLGSILIILMSSNATATLGNLRAPHFHPSFPPRFRPNHPNAAAAERWEHTPQYTYMNILFQMDWRY